MRNLCKLLLCFLLGFCSMHVLAQSVAMTITGRVLDGETQKPLVGATVYIERSKMAAPTEEGGAFKLSNIPAGNYNLIVSYVGYEPVSIPVTEQSSHRFAVELMPKQLKLGEVKINGGVNQAEYLDLFKLFFLGNAAKQCTITNEKSLSLSYDRASYVLTAEASRPLVIENKALGYKVYYELTDFIHRPGRTSYSGYTRFEEMVPANEKEEKRWKANRAAAYYGSFMHFSKALANRSLIEDGFVVKKLAKVPYVSAKRPVLEKLQGNEFKSPDTVVTMRWTGRDYTPEDTTVLSDSAKKATYWGQKSGYNVIYPQQVSYDSILVQTIVVGSYELSFKNSLFVTYKGKKVTEDFLGLGVDYKPMYPMSIITMLQPRTFLDSHGNLADPRAVLHEGYWAILRLANQLPDDYLPDKP